VGADGRVLDPAGWAVTRASGWQAVPDMASDSDGYTVVWADERGSEDGMTAVYGARLRDGGVAGNEFPIHLRSLGYAHPKIAPAGSRLFLVTAQGYQAEAIRAVGYWIALAEEPVITGLSLLPDGARLSWLSRPGRSYRVQFTPDLTRSNWFDLLGEMLSTNVVMQTIDSTAGQAPIRFYRVLELPAAEGASRQGVAAVTR
jgi:hypothetical protein